MTAYKYRLYHVDNWSGSTTLLSEGNSLEYLKKQAYGMTNYRITEVTEKIVEEKK